MNNGSNFEDIKNKKNLDGIEKSKRQTYDSVGFYGDILEDFEVDDEEPFGLQGVCKAHSVQMRQYLLLSNPESAPHKRVLCIFSVSLAFT